MTPDPALPPEDLQLVIDALHYEARLHGHDCRLHRDRAVALLEALAGSPAEVDAAYSRGWDAGVEATQRMGMSGVKPQRVGAAPPQTQGNTHGVPFPSPDERWGVPGVGAAPPEPPLLPEDHSEIAVVDDKSRKPFTPPEWRNQPSAPSKEATAEMYERIKALRVAPPRRADQ